MKKLFQTIFVSALSILLFTMPAFAAAPGQKKFRWWRNLFRRQLGQKLLS